MLRPERDRRSARPTARATGAACRRRSRTSSSRARRCASSPTRRATPSCSSPSRPTTTRPTCGPATTISLHWSPGAAYLLRGRSEIIGATTTDVDEVQASMDGKDVAEAKADDARRAEGAPVQPPGGADRRRRRRRRRGRRRAAVGRRRWRRRRRRVARGGRGHGRWRHRSGRDGARLHQLDRVHRPHRGRRARAPSTGSRTRPGSPSTTPRRSTTTTRCTARSSPPTSTPATRRRGTSPPRRTGWRPGSRPTGWLAPLPFNLIPNYVNLDPIYLNLAWDLGAKYHLPWQAGFTGIAYNISATRGRELTEHHRAVRRGVPRAHRRSSPRCATPSGW